MIISPLSVKTNGSSDHCAGIALAEGFPRPIYIVEKNNLKNFGFFKTIYTTEKTPQVFANPVFVVVCVCVCACASCRYSECNSI